MRELKLKDRVCSMRGEFHVQIYRGGKIIEDYGSQNLIVEGAREIMAYLLSGAEGKSISKIALGTSGSIPDPSDTIITNAFIKEISGYSYPALGEVEIEWHLLTTEANGLAIREFGLLSEEGVLFARKIREKEVGGEKVPAEAIYKEEDISIDGQWRIIF
jgi:hypothetical protein